MNLDQRPSRLERVDHLTPPQQRSGFIHGWTPDVSIIQRNCLETCTNARWTSAPDAALSASFKTFEY